jgi:SAM-dependent methyltransferase
MTTNTYRGLHAARYDLIYADKPYAEEAAFVARLLEQHGPGSGRLLDLACGTGRHAREFARMGWTVTGIDYSAELLEAARRNAPDVEFRHQDMRELELGDERFDAITCLFDSIGYPQTDHGVLATLSGAAAHLSPEGALAVDFLHAPALIRHAAPARVRRWEREAGELVRISETRLDLERDVMHVSYELFDLDADGALREHWIEEHANRFFTAPAFRALVARAGLGAVDIRPAYVDTGEIDDSVWHLIAIVKHA